MLYVTDKYLDTKSTKGKIIKNALNRVESIVHGMAFQEARQFLITLGGSNPKYIFGDGANLQPRYHFRPNGIGNAHRVIYSNHDGLSEIIKDNHRISGEAHVFFLITEESDHDDKQVKIAKSTCINEDEFVYRPLTFTKDDIAEVDGEIVEVFDSYYGFPIDDKQAKLVTKEYPLMIIGSAGSGKTVTALELFKKYHLENDNLNVAFITLTDRLRNKLQDELRRCGFPSNNCFTFAEFVNIEYKDLDVFIDIIREISDKLIIDKYDKSIYAKLVEKYPYLLNENSLYTIIRGFIKGRMNASNHYQEYNVQIERDKNELKKDLIITENYDRFLGADTGIVIDYIFKIYDEYIKRKPQDDNDFVVFPNPVWDCIIVDEVQDLTEKQLTHIIRCCKSQMMYFYGDPNQTINPTFFSFNRLDGIYKEIKHVENSINREQLKETYRTGVYLISYINYLADIRKTKIATQSDSWDDHERSLLKRKNNKWACLINKQESLDTLFRIFIDSEDCIIIVNDDEEKKRLKNQFSQFLGGTELIFPITQIKGLEHKNIIVFNMISKNHDRFREILSGSYKKSTVHRMIFNRYYVSLTRAKESIIIVETDIDKDMKSTFFEYDDGPIHMIVENVDEDMDLVENYIAKSNNPEAYMRSGDRFKENKYFVQAKEKYLKAVELAQQGDYIHLFDKAKNKLDTIQLMITYYEINDLTIEYKHEIARKLLVLGEYRFSQEIFRGTQCTPETNLIDYFMGVTTFLDVLKVIPQCSHLDSEVYEYLLKKTSFEDDYILTMSKMAKG
jgi:hypothetical protein